MQNGYKKNFGPSDKFQYIIGKIQENLMHLVTKYDFRIDYFIDYRVVKVLPNGDEIIFETDGPYKPYVVKVNGEKVYSDKYDYNAISFVETYLSKNAPINTN